MVILKTHLESLIRIPYLGLLVCRTVRTTETPGVFEVLPFTLEDSIFIHLCSTPGLKFSWNIIDKMGLRQLHFRLKPSLDDIDNLFGNCSGGCRVSQSQFFKLASNWSAGWHQSVQSQSIISLIPSKTRDCTLAQNIMIKYNLVGFEFYEAMPNELSLLLTPAIWILLLVCLLVF